MSDYRNPNDPMWQGEEYEPAGRSYGSGWSRPRADQDGYE
jgi:hypothetical protein